MKTKNLTKGFTLIELMIVITVIAILATIVLFGLSAAQRNARDVQRIQIMKSAQAALQQYASTNNGAYPATSDWAALTNPAGTNIGPLLKNPTNDPGCGTAATGVNVLNLTGGLTTTGGCTTATPRPAYAYTNATAGTCPANSGYTLTLTKEGGGVSYFCAPQ